jgi:hypothetical protein
MSTETDQSDLRTSLISTSFFVAVKSSDDKSIQMHAACQTAGAIPCFFSHHISTCVCIEFASTNRLPSSTQILNVRHPEVSMKASVQYVGALAIPFFLSLFREDCELTPVIRVCPLPDERINDENGSLRW